MFLLVVLAVWALPTQAALRPGEHATIDVSVATLWKAPNLYRSIDRPSVTNPVDPVQWSKNLSTTAARVWLDSHVQTQALYGQDVVVLARRDAEAFAFRTELDSARARQEAQVRSGWAHLLARAHGAGTHPAAACRRAAIAA